MVVAILNSQNIIIERSFMEYNMKYVITLEILFFKFILKEEPEAEKKKK